RWMLAAVLASGAMLTGSLVLARQSSAVQGTPLTRGNAYGEWRYWGADAWSTRYSPLDQINAPHFNSLQGAWQWNAGEDGPDEYFWSTPLYAGGRLFTVATIHRMAAALDPATGKLLWKWQLEEGIRWQKAPRQYSGRGLVYWTDGREQRVIE